MNPTVRLQLSVMMFIQYAIWGLWGVSLATYLLSPGMNFTGSQVGWAYNTNQIALILAPLFVGILTDRLFAIQHVLAVLHFASAGIMYYASLQTQPVGMFWALLAYSLLYFPTLALTNTISFRNMSDPVKYFPGIRVLGTIGWIAAGWTITLFLGNDQRALQASAALSVFMGIFCLFLPHTPPLPQKEGESRTTLDALGMLKDPTFAIFMLAAFAVSGASCFYYQQANPFLAQLPLPNGDGKTLGVYNTGRYR